MRKKIDRSKKYETVCRIETGEIRQKRARQGGTYHAVSVNKKLMAAYTHVSAEQDTYQNRYKARQLSGFKKKKLQNAAVYDIFFISNTRKGSAMRLKFRLSTTQTIMLSFLAAILLGSALLALPISAAGGRAVPYLDALFTATTSVCVTGLVTLPTVSTWSVFGQIVILILIQAGGLGIVTVIAGVMLRLHRRLGLVDRMLIRDSFNLNTMSGLVSFLKRVLIGTFAVEGTGALLYMTVFVPVYGPKGIWISVFNAISAFCNAGIDIVGENSLCPYVLNPTVSLTTCLLIILGGIGFFVWWDLLDVLRQFRRQKFKCLRQLSLHSKIALSSTGLLLAVGALLFFLFEYDNPRTIGDFGLPSKILASFFQSVTTRTAGFATVPQEDLSGSSSLFSLLLMMIGGSPTGTAGGIKTVSFTVLIASAFATVQGREDPVMFGRTISKPAVAKAVAVAGVSLVITFTSALLLEALTKADFLDVLYEAVSATATVGLTRNFTGTLAAPGKLVLIMTMFLGRIGPISLFIVLNANKNDNSKVKYPTEQISVG